MRYRYALRVTRHSVYPLGRHKRYKRQLQTDTTRTINTLNWECLSRDVHCDCDLPCTYSARLDNFTKRKTREIERIFKKVFSTKGILLRCASLDFLHAAEGVVMHDFH